MENTKMNEVVMAMVNDVRASGAKMDTKDSMYEVVSKYVPMTREQFEENYKLVKEQMNAELSENELDMVVGGGVMDWISEHKTELLIAAGVIFGCAGLGIAAGAMMAACATADGVAIAATTMFTGELVGGLCGELIGFGLAVDTLAKYKKGEF